jgi:ribonuclease inhibitor
MKEYIFDTSDINNIDQLHAALADLLGFPEHYGRNLDALYDCLSGEIELPVKLIWTNYASTHARLGEDAALFLEVMEDFSLEEPDFKIVIQS